MSGGRPSKYDPAFCEHVIAHMSEGASLTSFAGEIGVARSTINEWMEHHPAFSEAVKVGKAKCAAWWERVNRKNAVEGGGNATAAIFGLKNMAADEWREKIVQEHSGPDGEPIKTQDVTDPKDLARRTAFLLALGAKE